MPDVSRRLKGIITGEQAQDKPALREVCSSAPELKKAQRMFCRLKLSLLSSQRWGRSQLPQRKAAASGHSSDLQVALERSRTRVLTLTILAPSPARSCYLAPHRCPLHEPARASTGPTSLVFPVSVDSKTAELGALIAQAQAAHNSS